jgi:hypothetical protein
MSEGVCEGLRACARRVNSSNNYSMCPINKHLGVYLYERSSVSITMYVMPLSNHYITTQCSHRFIMDFYDLHVFPSTHVPCLTASIQRPLVVCSL